MLQEIISNETIKVHANVENWKEAIRECGNLLLQKGLIKEKYIDKMINSIEKYGPYVVIDKGIAIIHARPEDGSNDLGLAMLTLNEPIYFGNEENDPVRLVISFSSLDSVSHLNTLTELIVLITNKNRVEKIISAGSSKEVMKLLVAEDV